jgi:predicted Zn-dependent protease
MDPAPVYERCLVFEELGETAKAYEDILVVIHLQPDNSVAIRKKAKLAAEKKLWLEAIVTIDSLLQSNPEDYDLRLSRGKAFARVCKWEEAMQVSNFDTL